MSTDNTTPTDEFDDFLRGNLCSQREPHRPQLVRNIMQHIYAEEARRMASHERPRITALACVILGAAILGVIVCISSSSLRVCAWSENIVATAVAIVRSKWVCEIIVAAIVLLLLVAPEWLDGDQTDELPI